MEAEGQGASRGAEEQGFPERSWNVSAILPGPGYHIRYGYRKGSQKTRQEHLLGQYLLGVECLTTRLAKHFHYAKEDWRSASAHLDRDNKESTPEPLLPSKNLTESLVRWICQRVSSRISAPEQI